MAGTVWKGHITFGMVSFPVTLEAAARSRAIRFHFLHRCDHSRVKQVLYCQAENRPVPRTELVKGYEYDKDRYVAIDEHDIMRAEPRTARVMEVLHFVRAREIDPVFLDRSYYVTPEAAGKRPYTLLFQALVASCYVAVAQWTIHNREHLVLLRPGRHGLIVHTLYYEDEVRSGDEFHTGEAISARELELAQMLIEAMAVRFDPSQYHDRCRENLRTLIDSKIVEQERTGASAPLRLTASPEMLKVLQKTLAQFRKPVTNQNLRQVAKESETDRDLCHRPAIADVKSQLLRRDRRGTTR